ncbi:MAG: two-component regulator propeller domain-containing protein [Ferruginibacter sp.]
MGLKAVRYFFVFLILSFFIPPAYSQSFNTRLYTTADGLTDNYIFCIYQDSYGYLWVGTVNGLNRFDGKEFINFGLRHGLPSLAVDRVYEDHAHRIWLGTRAGMAELKGDSCYTSPVNDNAEITFVSGFLEPKPGILWATTNKGLYEFRKNIWVKINLFPGYENNSISKIISTSKGFYINYGNKILVHKSYDGLYKVLLNKKQNHAYYNNLFAINDTVFISTYSALLHLENDKWVSQFDDTLAKKFIYTSFRDNNNRYWFGTKQDGVLAAVQNGNKTDYIHISLSFNLVSNFFEDRNNNIWVAGYYGLLKISPTAYNSFSFDALAKPGSLRNCITLPSGNIVLSADNGKLLVVNPFTNATISPRVIAFKQLKNANDFIDFYTFDEKQRLLFTTRYGYLYRLDGTILTDLTSIVTCRNNGLRGIAYNKKTKQLFVCGDSVLLFGDENRLDTFFSNNKKFIPLPNIIHLEDEKGSMLVQTLNQGLALIKGNGEIQYLDKVINISFSILEKSTTGKNENIIWAVNRVKGIFKYRWKKESAPELLEIITEKNGLPINYILSIATDNEGRLWIATANGIVMMKKDAQQKWLQQKFEINQPVNTTALSFTKLNADNKDNIWMNMDNKLLVFEAKKTAIIPVQTNTVIEKILLYDKPTSWELLTDSVYSYRRLPVYPQLNHNQNTLSITFKGLQFNNNSSLEYSYRLQPDDNTWSNPTASNIVSFYQLSPGKYKFQVRSHLKGFEWSEPATFSFLIKKPFWETWWFRLLLVIVASAVIIISFRYRLSQVRKTTELKNQLTELEMKALKAQMNPHFIHNALNSIQSLIVNNRADEASYYISKFAKLLRQVFENFDKNLIPLDKELYSLRLYVELEKLRINSEVEYEEIIQDSILSSGIKIPPLILQPFVENALWHGLSNKSGRKKITISVSEKDNWIICQVTDNGIGRKKAGEVSGIFPEGNFSKAVNITRQRLIDYNKSPGIDPVSFTDLENKGEAAGTKVIIRIKA